MIGKCYLYSDNKFESIKYIQKAYELNPNVNFDIHLMMGMAYHQVYEFEKVPPEKKDKVVKQLALLNLERNKCIDLIDKQFRRVIKQDSDG